MVMMIIMELVQMMNTVMMNLACLLYVVSMTGGDGSTTDWIDHTECGCMKGA